MKEESVVLSYLEPYIAHQLKYRRFNLAYNVLNKASTSTVAALAGMAIFYTLMYFSKGTDIGIARTIVTYFAAVIAWSISMITIRELITFAYTAIYGKDFSQFLTIPTTTIGEILSQIEYNQNEFSEVLKKIQASHSIIYGMVTSGIDKKIIPYLYKIEIKSKMKERLKFNKK